MGVDPAAVPDSHRRLVERSIQGVLTTVRHRDGLLSSTPVAYLWEDGLFLISTLTSRVKYRNVQHDPRVALCIVSGKDPTHYLEVRGRATLQDDPDGTFAVRQFRAIMGMDPPPDLDPPGSQRAVIVVHPERISAPKVYGGRFDELLPDS